MGRSHLTAIARKFRTQRACYVAARTQAGHVDEDLPYCSHVAARNDPRRALVQSCEPDAGPPNRLFRFRVRSRVQDFSRISHIGTCSARIGPNRKSGPASVGKSVRAQVTRSLQYRQFQARRCNTLAFRAAARSATHRYRVRRPALWPRARAGARTATLPWREGRDAEKGVLSPLAQRRRPAGVVQRLRAGPSHSRAAHLRAADTAHGRADEIENRATGRL